MKKAFLVFGLAAAALSARAEKFPVYVACASSPSDSIGPRVCTALLDTIARSPRHRLAADPESLWTISVASAYAPGDWSALSVVLERNDVFMAKPPCLCPGKM
jgi:hypothetical protein